MIAENQIPAEPEVNRDVAKRRFKYYIFDWDDNILHMPTTIRMEKRNAQGAWEPVSVSTSVYAVVRLDPNYRFPSEGGQAAAFRDFQDVPDSDTESAFIRDTRLAIRKIASGEKPGPSFETFRKTLREGRIFAIVTARGHEPQTLRKAVRLFIDHVLTAEERRAMLASLRGYRRYIDKCTTFGTDDAEIDYYLSVCCYHPVMSDAFRARLLRDADFGGRYAQADRAIRSELAKKFAVLDFVEHVSHWVERAGGVFGKRPVSIGFSDDDVRNVKAVSEYIGTELARRYGTFKFVIYDTSDPTLANGRKIVISGAKENASDSSHPNI